MKYKAIIFDMDGTIIETEHIWHLVTRTIIENKGVTIDEHLEKVLKKNLTGLGMREACQFVKDLCELKDDVHTLVREKEELANKLYREEIRFIDGFLKFHQKIINLNIPIGLATNASDETVQITNQKLDLRKLFGEHVYNISMVHRGKPDPAIYLHAAAKLNIDPEYCIAFEDSAHGIAAAKAAGMYTVGIMSSEDTHHQVKESHHITKHYDHIDLDSLLVRKNVHRKASTSE